jgi:hypothetical protein
MYHVIAPISCVVLTIIVKRHGYEEQENGWINAATNLQKVEMWPQKTKQNPKRIPKISPFTRSINMSRFTEDTPSQ